MRVAPLGYQFIAEKCKTKSNYWGTLIMPFQPPPVPSAPGEGQHNELGKHKIYPLRNEYKKSQN